MASSNRKLSQQELRQLMKEKVQNKNKNFRIDSPLAKYDDKNQLWCIVCNQIISSEYLWSTHLIGKAHKKKVEELKQIKNRNESTKTTLIKNIDKISTNNPLKRILPSEDREEEKTVPIKVAKSSSNIQSNNNNVNNKQNQEPSNKITDTSLPQDFFDDSIKPTISIESSNNVGNDSDQGQALPKGFFDDPEIDAKMRKVTHIESLDAQFELFRKEIAEESLVSENIIEEEAELVEKDKEINEIDEQIEKWIKVNQFEKKLEETKQKKQMEIDQPMTTGNDDDDDETSDQDDEQLDLNDMNFWRNKGVFH